VAIAGDFINVFRPEPLNVQIFKAKAFLWSLARKTRVAISSGNHDAVDEVDSSPRGPVPMWMAALDSINILVSDGPTGYRRSISALSSTFAKGRSRRVSRCSVSEPHRFRSRKRKDPLEVMAAVGE
jgi:hypothetical protein